MKKLVAMLALAVLLAVPGLSQARCSTVDGALNLSLHLEVLGAYFDVELEPYSHPSDPGGFYWKLQSFKPAAPGLQSSTLTSTLDIHIPCLQFGGVQFSLVLAYYPNPADPKGYFWKLKSFSLASIEAIEGADLDCYTELFGSLEDLNTYYSCLIGCGSDLACAQKCLEGLPGAGGSAFLLQITLKNPTPAPVTFTLEGCTAFLPTSGAVQKMVLLQTATYTVPPGTAEFCVPVYCMNADLAAPSEGDTFSLSNCNSSCLAEIVTLVTGKDVSKAGSRIQEIVWDCMETGSLSAEAQAYLEGLKDLS